MCACVCRHGRQKECGDGGRMPSGNEPVRQFRRAVYARALGGMGTLLCTTYYFEVDLQVD